MRLLACCHFLPGRFIVTSPKPCQGVRRKAQNAAFSTRLEKRDQIGLLQPMDGGKRNPALFRKLFCGYEFWRRLHVLTWSKAAYRNTR